MTGASGLSQARSTAYAPDGHSRAVSQAAHQHSRHGPDGLPVPAQKPVVERPNQVWDADICYLPTAKAFMFLVAVMDWHSRRLLRGALPDRLAVEAHYFSGHTSDARTLLPLVDLLDVTGSNPA
jgi:transposase InsO family protein